MSNLVNITLNEADYQSLLINGTFLNTKIISTKILPDDSNIKDNEAYQIALKEYKKARDKKEMIAFQLTTNK